MTQSFQDRIIHDHASGLSFCDMGGLWGTVNEKVTVALKAGAASAAMADMQVEGNDLWRAFHEHAAAAGAEGYASFPGVNIDDPNIKDKIGAYDFVHCAGVLYHVPSPLLTLQNLRSIVNRYLLLGSMIVPDSVVTSQGALDFTGGRMIFIPSLDEKTRGVMAEHFDSRGLKIMYFNTPHRDPFRIAEGYNYSPWWWLYSAGTLKAMIELAGFKVLELGSDWDGRVSYIFCEAD